MRSIALLLCTSALALYAGDANDDLLAACRAGDLAAAKSSIEKGAAIETKTPYGQTPLYIAAMNGHEEVVRFLLDKGATTDVKDTFYKAPMLGFVLQRKHWGVAKLLIAKSTNRDQTLDDVSSTGHAELVQAVLDGAKPSQAALDKAYESALSRKHAEVADLLKKVGAHEPPPPFAVDAAVLASYAGTYRSEQIPVEVKASVKEGKLIIQPVGQGELAMKALSATHFVYAPSQLDVEFDGPDNFTLKTQGGSFKFKKGAAK
jgi:hypothetical protein